MTISPHMFYSKPNPGHGPELPLLHADSSLLEAALMLDPRLMPALEKAAK